MRDNNNSVYSTLIKKCIVANLQFWSRFSCDLSQIWDRTITIESPNGDIRPKFGQNVFGQKIGTEFAAELDCNFICLPLKLSEQNLVKIE